MTRDLLEQIADDLGIRKGIKESEASWKTRVAYSAAGKMALGSLWDEEDDNKPISVRHFKQRAERELTALCKIDSDVKDQFEDATLIKNITDEIYDIYLSCGYIYHSSNRIAPCEEKIVRIKGLSFVRGCGLQEPLMVCGLGLYESIEYVLGNYEPVESLVDLYQLQTAQYDKCLEKSVNEAEWQEIKIAGDVEYLRIKPPFYYGYWQSKPDEQVVSLMRTKANTQGQQHSYYLYKKEGQMVKARQLPYWLIENKGYRFASNWILKRQRTLPPSLYINDGDLIHLHIQYLYSPNIQNFIKLFSWPKYFNDLKKSAFERVMNRDVFRVIRKTLETLGFQFKEGK
jgi:hypothetical protein